MYYNRIGLNPQRPNWRGAIGTLRRASALTTSVKKSNGNNEEIFFLVFNHFCYNFMLVDIIL